MKNKKNILLIFIVLVVLSSLALLNFTKSSAIKDLENDVEVKVNSELTYYLNVSYDGVDRNSYDSRIPEEGVRSKLYSGYIYVEDKLPEGLTFQNFVTSGNGSVGAVNPITGRSCLGEVFNDTEESEQSDSNYYGLHYDETTHTVHFRVKGLEAGCVLTVGVVTKTPETVDDPETELVEERRDFYNFATAREENLTKYSNTVHVFIQEGEEEIELHTVTYKYEEGTPTNAPNLPEETSYAKNTSVGIASEPYLEGYKFNGWKVESDSGTVVPATNTMFIMPDENVTLVGSFTKLDSYEVSYSIEGEIPDGFVVPSTKEYYPNQDVIVGMYAGDEYNGYRFSGWKTSDVEQNKDGDFVMPENDVHLIGSFELVTYTVTYEFTGETLPPNSSKYLPPSQSYPVGATVKLPVVQDAPGYHFRGWEEGDNFPMPAEDIVVTGEWDIQRGTFSPTIKKEIVNPQEVYKVGDIVEFKITVTNTAGYAITNVNVSENNENAKFIKNVGYSLRTDRLVLIDYMDPYSSTVINAEYEVTEKDNGVIINEVEILGADSTNYYDLDLTKEYKASASFKVLSKLNICKTVTNVDDKDLFQFHISGNNYNTWINISSNECKEIYIATGDYQITEIIPQSYELTEITYSSNLNGNQTNNILNFTIGTDSNYEITFTNRYLTKNYLHQSGREENIIEGNSISKEDMETLDWSKISYIKIVWDDEGNNNKRPDTLALELYQDGSIYKETTLDSTSGWLFDLYESGWQTEIINNPNSVWNISEDINCEYALKITLDNNTLIFTNTYNDLLCYDPIATTLNKVIKEDAVLDNKSSEYVEAETGINFAAISSDTNGKGSYIYTDANGEIYNSENPIYYYRGDVENNNVIFANQCWKMVRTTETGGVKLLYNGTPVEASGTVPLGENEYDVKANPASSSLVSPSPNYEFKYDSSVKKWTSSNKAIATSASGIEFTVKESGHYILHYTASSESTSYDYGVVYKNGTKIGGPYGGTTNSGTIDLGTIDSSTTMFIAYRKDGSVDKNDDSFIFWLEKEVEPALTCPNTGAESQLSETSKFNEANNSAAYVGYTYGSTTELRGSTSSTIKTNIENWYKINIEDKGYSKYIEDTIYCADRVPTLSGSTSNYGFYTRSYINSNKPLLSCSLQEDSYTVNSTSYNYNSTLNGNKLLNYPVALLTGDEIQLAGYAWGINNTSTYFHTGQAFWLMSPAYFNGTIASVVRTDSSGTFYSTDSSYGINYAVGVRPTISLRAGINIRTDADSNGEAGTSYNPYIVIER